eukprot:scaffold90512_cov72-Phaeocystis_antarctica.AAC.4
MSSPSTYRSTVRRGTVGGAQPSSSRHSRSTQLRGSSAASRLPPKQVSLPAATLACCLSSMSSAPPSSASTMQQYGGSAISSSRGKHIRKHCGTRPERSEGAPPLEQQPAAIVKQLMPIDPQRGAWRGYPALLSTVVLCEASRSSRTPRPDASSWR